MKSRLIGIRAALGDSFWFLPALMALIAAAGALASIAFDHSIGSAWVRDIGWVWSGGADGARGVLAVVAGSVMTVVSIVFSLTIAVLAQTSSHYGPRVLRNFTSDRGVQFTLGAFIATFVYCLLVLRTVRSIDESIFVPYLSVNIGVLLALASLAVLIYFIHHISQSIQAENLIASVGRDFQEMLPLLFPERSGERRNHPDAEVQWDDARAVSSNANGYLLSVDYELLMGLAIRHDLQLKILKRTGDFVWNGIPLLVALPSSEVTDLAERALRTCFNTGVHRTRGQDVLYSIQQLSEIAAHAMSPGINEPYTALTCIDWLGASLRGVAIRDLPIAQRHDQNGRLRVSARTVDFDELARTAFDQIRIYGASNPTVVIRLLDTIAELAPATWRQDDRDSLVHHARLIGADASQVDNENDRERVAARLANALRALAAPGSRPAIDE